MTYVNMNHPWSNPTTANTSFSPTIVNVTLTHECKEELRAIVREVVREELASLHPEKTLKEKETESEPHA